MDQLTVFRTLRDVASRINASSDLAETLKHILEAVCFHSVWAAGGIMSVDPGQGCVQVIARHDPAHLGESFEDRWVLAESPTALVLARNEPMIIPDAQTSAEFPGYRREAIQRGYRTVVLLPMDYRGPEGYLTVLSVRSREIVRVTEQEIAFLQLLVHLGAIAMNKGRSLMEEQASGKRLRAALSAHGSLLQQVLANGSLLTTATTVTSMLPNPLVIVDLISRLVLSERSPQPAIIDDQRWKSAVKNETGRQFLDIARQAAREGRIENRDLMFRIGTKRLQVPASISPLLVDNDPVGALIVFSESPDSSDLDHLLLDSARFGLSVQMMRAHTRFRTEARNVEDLFSALLEGTWSNSVELAERAMRLGIDLDKPAQLIVLHLPDESSLGGQAALEVHRSIADLAQPHDGHGAAILRAGSIVIHCPVQPKGETRLQALLRRAIDEVRLVTGEIPVAVQSKVCRELADYPSAWRECGRILSLARRFGRRGEVTTRDFGPFPVLMSAVDTAEMRTFVEDLIGAVVKYDAAHKTPYIATLSTFLNHGCRSQPCATAMGLHVTTLRYRLARLRDLFGLQTDTPEQRFALQLALHFQDILTPRSG